MILRDNQESYRLIEGTSGDVAIVRADNHAEGSKHMQTSQPFQKDDILDDILREELLY